ncbi:MAG TPA: c-type cytochrome [Acetobacteraceae bacterium]
MPIRTARFVGLALLLALGGCSHSEGGSTSATPAAALPSEASIAAVPMGHMAGMLDSAALARSIHNPYANDPQAIAAGKALYIRMNCVTCHAAGGKGNMGPDLTDTYWRYGGLPVEIYKSIHDGRAKGMPAWGAMLPPPELWKLVAYIQSFGGTYATDGSPPNPQQSEQIAPELASPSGDAQASGEAAAPGTATAPPASLPASASSR